MVSKDYIILLLGFFLGLVGTIFAKILDYYFDKKGKLKIYVKPIHSSINNNGGWENEYSYVPSIKIELQNTTNTNKIIRDISLDIYFKGGTLKEANFVSKFNDNFFGNEGSSSFMVEGNSIATYTLQFEIKKEQVDNKEGISNVSITYYDIKDKKRSYSLYKNIDSLNVDISNQDWILLNKKGGN